jgi:hypothetical protein
MKGIPPIWKVKRNFDSEKDMQKNDRGRYIVQDEFLYATEEGPTNRMTLERQNTKIKGIVSRVGSFSFLHTYKQGERTGKQDSAWGGGQG